MKVHIFIEKSEQTDTPANTIQRLNGVFRETKKRLVPDREGFISSVRSLTLTKHGRIYF